MLDRADATRRVTSRGSPLVCAEVQRPDAEPDVSRGPLAVKGQTFKFLRCSPSPVPAPTRSL